MRFPKIATVLLLLAIAPGIARADDDVMVVFDGSNSMWGQIDGVAKIEIAQDVMAELFGDWADQANVGLMAYGHRREGDCTDIETIIAPGPVDRDAFMARIAGITPRGKTPLTSAIEQAAEALAYRDNPATVILISDGIESCQRDPCELAASLERAGIGFTAHVVGFGLAGEDEQDALACIAEQTGGQFIAAQDAAELGEALGEVSVRLNEPAADSVEMPENGWTLVLDGDRYEGKIADLRESDATATLQLVNEDALNIVLRDLDMTTGPEVRASVFLAFGRGETCADALNTPFTVTVTTAPDTMFAGSFDGALTCSGNDEIRNAVGAFRIERNAN